MRLWIEVKSEYTKVLNYQITVLFVVQLRELSWSTSKWDSQLSTWCLIFFKYVRILKLKDPSMWSGTRLIGAAMRRKAFRSGWKKIKFNSIAYTNIPGESRKQVARTVIRGLLITMEIVVPHQNHASILLFNEEGYRIDTLNLEVVHFSELHRPLYRPKYRPKIYPA